ncbi:MAG: CorA family divalent cation transporter, partial [bacterium]
MPRFFRQLHTKTGISPGTIEYTGERKVEKVTVSVLDYDEKNVDERQVESPEQCYQYRDTAGVSWINVNGLHDTDLLKNLGGHFGIHTLVLEDILNTHHRPKIEDHGEYLFVILKMLSYDDAEDRVIAEQVSIILGSTYVLSFQERGGDVFEPVRQRIRTATGRIRSQGPDYLAYALVDAVVDHYLVVLEKLGEQIEDLENSLVTEPTPELLQEI